MTENKPSQTSAMTTGRFRWLSWTVGAALIASLYLWLGVGEILNVLAALRPMPLLLALGAFALGHVVRIVKWRLPLGSQYGWLELTRLFLVSKVGGALLPAHVGELAPLAESRFRSTAVAAWLAADRIVEAYATLVLGALGLVSLGLGDWRIVALWIVAALILLGAFGLLLYRRLWAWLEDRTRRWKPLRRLFGLARRVSEDVWQFRRHALPIAGLSLLGTYLDLWLIKSLFLATGTSVPLNVIAASSCLSALVTFIAFTPGGLGFVELTSVYIYNLYGVPQIQTGVVLLLLQGAPLLQTMGLMTLAALRGHPSGTPQSRLTICLVASDGGHLTDLIQLGREACGEHRTFYLTHRSTTTVGLPNAYFVQKIGVNVWQLLLASLTLLRVFWRERPDVVISTGAEIALPAFYLGKLLFGARLVYVECSGVAAHPSRTGRLLYPVSDLFLVQWETLLQHYGPRARYVGGLI
jgi:beta-1,4-N-acetylglucosaminyltransferase